MIEIKRVSTTAERLKEAMQTTGKRQADIVSQTGLNRGTISNYLSGKYEPKSGAINKLAIALNVSEAWLWGYDVPKERNTNGRKESLNGISENRKKLLEFCETVPEDKAEMILRVMKSILEHE